MSDSFATKADLGVSRVELGEVKVELMDRIERVETTLLTEFHKYAQSSERRMLATEVSNHTLSDRVAALETRVRELERKN